MGIFDQMPKDSSYPFENKSLTSIKGERWKAIPGFEGYYQASNMGRVRSVDRIIPHPRHGAQTVYAQILSQSIARNRNIKTGEPMIDMRVCLNLEGVQYYFNTRRIVYKTFKNPALDYPTDHLYVINIDGDGYNNKLSNLKTVTRSEKSKRVFERDRMDSYLKTADRSTWTKPYGRHTTRKPVKQYLKRKLIARYESIAEAARQTGFGEKEIIMAAKGRWKHYKGFIWKYV